MAYIMWPYDEALDYILRNGTRGTNRTGIDTISVFGIQSRYRINEHFPLITKRKISPKAIFAELLWFLSGSTNNNDLQALGSNIWTAWVDKEFEKRHDFDDGDLGPIYGHQLRYFGAPYPIHSFTDMSECVDQLERMVSLLKKDPTSRRNLFSLWNPLDEDRMRLHPCHYTFQVYVADGKLSGGLTQRSCDFPIGVPANIQFYSALIYMLAAETGLEPYEFVHNTMDSHIYVNQIEQVKEYLSRPEVESPKLEYTKIPDILSHDPQPEWLDNFKVIDYNPLEKIKIPVAV